MLGVCLKYDQTNYGSKLQALATVKLLEEQRQKYKIICYIKNLLEFLVKYTSWLFSFVPMR